MLLLLWNKIFILPGCIHEMFPCFKWSLKLRLLFPLPGLILSSVCSWIPMTVAIDFHVGIIVGLCIDRTHEMVLKRNLVAFKSFIFPFNSMRLLSCYFFLVEILVECKSLSEWVVAEDVASCGKWAESEIKSWSEPCQDSSSFRTLCFRHKHSDFQLQL